jgi:hypothetical protein
MLRRLGREGNGRDARSFQHRACLLPQPSRLRGDPDRVRLVHDVKAYDSKAIVGVAHGFLPAERPLSARDFSGGEATVGHLLQGLGFTVQAGELTASTLVRLLTRLNVYYSGGLPALYQPITLLWAISRAGRGEPRLIPGAKRNGRSPRWWSATADRPKRPASTTR